MNLLFLGTYEDKVYLPRLKTTLSAHQTYVHLEPILTWIEVVQKCKKLSVTGIITTSQALLTKLVPAHRAKPSVSNYAGSYFERDGIQVVVVNPLSQMLSVSYGKFLLRHYISKITQPEEWIDSTPFSWEMLTPSNAERIFMEFQSAFMIACDIETFKHNLAIRCIGYTAFFYTPEGAIRSHSVVLPVDSLWALAWMRKFNWELPAPKGFQNGKYDLAYLARYDAPVYNYLFDSINMAHCWYVEMPKDLAFTTTFYVRKSWYWKDMADSSDLSQYYEYCARDTWGTGNSIISWLVRAPEWAKQNYIMEFPMVFPAHLIEMQGIRVDQKEFNLALGEAESVCKAAQNSLDLMVGVKDFNVNSYPQMKKLFAILGCGDLESQDEKNIAKASYRHPLNSRILDQVLTVRGQRKAISTYLKPEVQFNGRILYSENPHGTDTGRQASREHHFWTGLNITNIPRGNSIKRYFQADDGFLFGECDLEQAESRDTAHIAGDEKLIAAVSGDRDFHSVNAAAFFGVDYDSIYDQKHRKTLDKVLRDLAKRVNHGANYNMGAGVLVETMGLKEIYAAAKRLNLPKFWEPKKIAEYLLAQFHRTYPSLQQIYYPGVVHDVETTRLLIGATGWTRYCFGDPTKNKRDLNSYVAHAPQSLNAMVLNKAFKRIFEEIAMHTKHQRNFRLCAQIHDSVLFQFRTGHEYLAELVQSFMEISVTVRGYDGKTRTFVVPAALKLGASGAGATHWALTE